MTVGDFAEMIRGWPDHYRLRIQDRDGGRWSVKTVDDKRERHMCQCGEAHEAAPVVQVDIVPEEPGP